MPDGISISIADKPSRLDAEAKAHRVLSLIAAAREIDDNNATYEYAKGIRESIRGCLITMAFEEAEELDTLISEID
jgi:hypothetical protein